MKEQTVFVGWLAMVWLGALSATAGAADATQPPVDYMIVVTGSELLAGVYPDTHTHFLTRTLTPLNLHCVGSISVDDKPADIKEALRFGLSKTPLVIVTGGLGPTDDDVTRETLADFAGIPLQEQEDVLAGMERRFQLPRDKIRANLRRQTRVPSRGTYLKSAFGTAVGLVYELPKAVIVALPGPPRELQPMVREELVPYLNRRFGTRLAACTLMLRFVGVGQSQIDHTFKEHVPLAPDITVTSQFAEGRVDFEFALPADTPQNRARLAELKQQIQPHLGDYIYADDDTTLEQRVVRLLESRGVKLVLAEAGSGGCLATGLDGVEGVQRVLAGAYVAPTEEQLRRLLRVPDDKWGALPADTSRIECLAAAAVEATGSLWAVAIGDVQQADGGGRAVEVVFQQPEGRVEHQRLALRGTGELARTSLATQLLDALRRRLR
ncbi:MAG: molybdopterin-binding protein [Planctomycetota bacterium]|nr:molybdopterin-binding protein [Planctomycetota bacterium]